jgi:hypothetical protein
MLSYRRTRADRQSVKQDIDQSSRFDTASDDLIKRNHELLAAAAKAWSDSWKRRESSLARYSEGDRLASGNAYQTHGHALSCALSRSVASGNIERNRRLDPVRVIGSAPHPSPYPRPPWTAPGRVSRRPAARARTPPGWPAWPREPPRLPRRQTPSAVVVIGYGRSTTN